MISENLPDCLETANSCNSRMNVMDDMDAVIAAEEAKVPFRSFNLGTAEGREALLWKYYRIGDSSLFEAVAQVWDSLNEPKAFFGTRIGLAAGTGGKGKRGLVLMLHKFLDEALASMVSIPPTGEYDSLEEWHQASIKTFVEEEAAIADLVQRYAQILDGQLPSGVTPKTNCVLQGPWIKK